MLDQLLASVKPQIVAALGSKLGLSPAAADQFIGKALPMITTYFKSGKVDASALMGALGGGGSSGLAGLLKGFDAGPLAGLVGGDAEKARAGVGEIAGPLLSQVQKSGNAEDLIGQLVGGGGGLSGLLGKAAGLLGKK